MSFFTSSSFKFVTQTILQCPLYIHQSLRFATKKAGGSTKNGRKSAGKRLGLKKFGAEWAISGNILVRQRGRTVWPGLNVGIGRDHTLYALAPGYVTFTYDDRRHKERKYINIVDENPNPGPYYKKDKHGNIIDPLYPGNLAKADVVPSI